jgi:hypothetical protein
VEDLEVEEAAAAVVVVVVVHLGGLPDAHLVVHQAVPDPEALQLPAFRVVQGRQVVPGLGVSFHPVTGPSGRRRLSRSLDSLDRMGHHLNPTILALVRVPAFLGDFVAVEFWGPLPIDTAGVTAAVPGRPPVGTILSTRRSLPWQRGRGWGLVVVVSPSGSKLVGWAGAYWRVMVIKLVRGSGRLLSVQRLAALSFARPQPGNS